MLFVIGMFVGLFIGGLVAAAIAWLLYMQVQSLKSALARKPDHMDFKELWQRTLDLRVENGEMTREQMDELKELAGVLKQPELDAPGLPQDVLDTMSSYDRCLLEIDRAKKGLPRADDLNGMSSYDILLVEQARQKHGTSR